MELFLTLNGEPRKIVVADPDMPLVFVLRDTLGLTGTKYSCLQGLCGVCTIHVDGRAMRSCQMTAREVEGAALTTIEGLSPDGTHPVQRAWVEGQVAQCGWCQPGQIMQAASLLAETPHPSETQVRETMDGNICRCGSGPRILRAVARAAELAGENAP
ncbi:MAG: (2Fe-2S)-binding protein [Caenispirillum sp.]|nr:(2Fe-2S)-binding protein [Caenispirillum sp.]